MGADQLGVRLPGRGLMPLLDRARERYHASCQEHMSNKLFETQQELLTIDSPRARKRCLKKMHDIDRTVRESKATHEAGRSRPVSVPVISLWSHLAKSTAQAATHRHDMARQRLSA